MDSPSTDTPLFAALEAEILRKIVNPPAELSKEGSAKFRWNPDYLEIRTVDPANVIMVEQKVTPAVFETYNVNPAQAESAEEEFIFGTPCRRFSELLDAAETDDTVFLQYNPETTKLDIQFADVNYSLGGADLTSIEEPPKEELEYTHRFRAHSRVFDRATKVVGMVGPTMTFEIGNNMGRIFASGDTDDVELELRVAEDNDNLTAESSQPDILFKEDNGGIKATYGSEYIRYLPDFTPDDFLEIRMRDKYPMELKANRADRRIPTTIRVAPRVQSE